MMETLSSIESVRRRIILILRTTKRIPLSLSIRMDDYWFGIRKKLTPHRMDHLNPIYNHQCSSFFFLILPRNPLVLIYQTRFTSPPLETWRISVERGYIVPNSVSCRFAGDILRCYRLGLGELPIELRNHEFEIVLNQYLLKSDGVWWQSQIFIELGADSISEILTNFESLHFVSNSKSPKDLRRSFRAIPLPWFAEEFRSTMSWSWGILFGFIFRPTSSNPPARRW